VITVSIYAIIKTWSLSWLWQFFRVTIASSVTVTGRWNGKVENFHFNTASNRTCTICKDTGQIELISKMHIIYQQHRSAVRRMVQRYCYWACIWDVVSMNLGSTASHPVWELCFTSVSQNMCGCLQNLYLLATCVHFPISFHIA